MIKRRCSVWNDDDDDDYIYIQFTESLLLRVIHTHTMLIQEAANAKKTHINKQTNQASVRYLYTKEQQQWSRKKKYLEQIHVAISFSHSWTVMLVLRCAFILRPARAMLFVLLFLSLPLFACLALVWVALLQQQPFVLILVPKESTSSSSHHPPPTVGVV